MKNERGISTRCSFATMLQDAFHNNTQSACDTEELVAFKKVFLSEGHYGLLEDNENAFYSVKDGALIIFLITDNGSIIKIDSDFLDKDEIQAIAASFFLKRN